MKLTPNVTDITEIAYACAEGGADGISLINNFKAMRIDIKTRKTITAENMRACRAGHQADCPADGE